MKMEIKEVSELGREILFEVDKETVDGQKQKIVQEIKQNVDIPGFRKGKAPNDLIVTKHSDLIQKRLLEQVIPDCYLKAIKEKGFSPVTEPEAGDVKFEEGKLTFKVFIELKPEVNIKKYVGLTVKRVKPKQVEKEDVDKVLSNWEKRPEFAASIIDPEKRKSWEKKIREQLESIAKTEAVTAEDEQIWSQLLDEVDFPVPEKLVEQRARRYADDYLQRIDLKGKSNEEIKGLAENMIEKAKPSAQKDLKRYFVINKIAEVEKISASEKDIESRITHLSRSVGEPVDEVKKKIEETDRMEDLKAEIVFDKTFDFIKAKTQPIERIILPGEGSGSHVKKL